MRGPMLLLNSLLAGRSCVIKRFVLPRALLRNFSLEKSLSHPPNLKSPQKERAPFTSSFITALSPGNSFSFIFNFESRPGILLNKGRTLCLTLLYPTHKYSA